MREERLAEKNRQGKKADKERRETEKKRSREKDAKEKSKGGRERATPVHDALGEALVEELVVGGLEVPEDVAHDEDDEVAEDDEVDERGVDHHGEDRELDRRLRVRQPLHHNLRAIARQPSHVRPSARDVQPSPVFHLQHSLSSTSKSEAVLFLFCLFFVGGLSRFQQISVEKKEGGAYQAILAPQRTRAPVPVGRLPATAPHPRISSSLAYLRASLAYLRASLSCSTCPRAATSWAPTLWVPGLLFPISDELFTLERTTHTSNHNAWQLQHRRQTRASGRR